VTESAGFSALLRAWRDRLQPAAVGLPTGQRRTSGLRREEVAMLAGLSVDYVVRLEQGRADRPSEQVVGALARVLQLSDLERDQLYLAAGLPAPVPSRVPTHIPGSVQRMLARLPEVAIGVWTTHWWLLTANPAWTALMGPVEVERNLLVDEFTDTGVARVREPDHTESFRRALVSDLRTARIRYPDDPSVSALVQKLERLSPRFVEMWAESTLVEHRSCPKTFIHPAVGRVTLDCDLFTVAGTDLRIVTYTAAPGTEDESRFDLIRTVGRTEIGLSAGS
jgi:transcriptional regulator with XRE-family HTH domain